RCMQESVTRRRGRFNAAAAGRWSGEVTPIAIATITRIAGGGLGGGIHGQLLGYARPSRPGAASRNSHDRRGRLSGKARALVRYFPVVNQIGQARRVGRPWLREDRSGRGTSALLLHTYFCQSSLCASIQR